jgi:hypothetical protein
VKKDWADNPDFERHWLEARQMAQAEEGATPKKGQTPTTTSALRAA